MKIRKIKNLKRDTFYIFSRKNFIRLDKNEKVDVYSKKILNKIKFSPFDLSAYPETGLVYKKIAKLNKISIKNIILTAGSEFGIRMCFEYFCHKGNKKIITINPTFGMVDVYAKLFNINQVRIGYNKNLQLDIKKLEKNISDKISLIILANPNSPTGTVMSTIQLKKILYLAEKKNIPVLIDEAYYGFYQFSYLKYLKRYKNLLILRTFSKSYGLAGLRAGYLIANKPIIKELYKFKPMYELNSMACKALLFFLNRPKTHLKYISEVNKGKIFFECELKKLKISFLKTYANFLHIDLGKKKQNIEKKLLANKILTRKGPGVKGLESFLRITLGPKRQMKKVLRVLKAAI